MIISEVEIISTSPETPKPLFGKGFRALQFYMEKEAVWARCEATLLPPAKGYTAQLLKGLMKERDNYSIVYQLDSKTAEILLYTDIGTYEGCISANSFVRELKILERANYKINLRINCNGGSVYEGIAIFNAVKNCKCEIDCYIDGIAASMASLIAMACKKVYMSKYARLMTHLPSGGAWGNADDLRATADELDALTAIAVIMYHEKTKLSDAEVTAKFLNGRDNFFSAKQAKEAGLIDDTYDGDEVTIPDNITDKVALWSAYNTQLVAKRINNDSETLIYIS